MHMRSIRLPSVMMHKKPAASAHHHRHHSAAHNEQGMLLPDHHHQQQQQQQQQQAKSQSELELGSVAAVSKPHEQNAARASAKAAKFDIKEGTFKEQVRITS
jgi:hypothetical protein